jgi:predicted RNA methylase
VKKSPLDKFYTKPEVAKFLISKLNLSDFDLIIEPSAGNGAFSSQIDNCLAFDICPEHPSIVEQDFLLYEYNGKITSSKILCIGNPPFGKQCSLALKFIKKCSEFSDTIAFILPLSFKKSSIQNKIPKSYHLFNEVDIPEGSFLINGMSCSVPVVFQIWKNEYVDRHQEDKVYPEGFQYTKKSTANLSVRRVGVNAGKAFYDTDKSDQSHYFIKTDANIVDALNRHQWQHNNTVGPRSISKQELNKVINDIISQL